MTSERQNRRGESNKAKKVRVARTQTEPEPSPASIGVGRSGGWMASEDLREAALAALETGGDMALNLQGIDYLDASALQILLAFEAEQKKRGRNLQLSDASPQLRQWFEFAGVVDRFSMNERECDE